jgi:hypothetical protein
VSADTPRDPSTTPPHHAEQHARRTESDSGPRAEQAPSGQRADAGRSQQPEHTNTPGRAEHNEARRATPPLQRPGDAERPGDGGHRGPAGAAVRRDGFGTDRHPEQAELRHETGTGTRHHSPAETPSRSEHNEARHARPPIERAATPPERRDDSYSWPPPQADRDSARALYREDFGSKTTADSTRHGRDRGTSVVGDKPDKSPGDTSGLPPTGADLLEMEDKDESRADKFRKKLYGEFDDVIDSEKDGVETVMDLTQRPPTGHPEVQVNVGPMFGPEIPQHATVDPSSITELAMVLGVISFQAGRWFHHKIEPARKE